MPGRSSTGTQPGDNESRPLPGPLGFSETLLVQEKMKTEPKALTLCFSLGRKIFLSNILEDWFMYRMFISAENHPRFHTQKNITMISYMRNLLIVFNELPLYWFTTRETVLIKIISRIKLEALLDIFGDIKVSSMGKACICLNVKAQKSF